MSISSSTADPALSAEFTPSYVSSRSANSLISFSRPTRIQAVTLDYLNRTLDELLLHILASAKSLATDRIKTDGILRVLGGQSGTGSGAGALLAKNAVLEAELELRGYLDGQRKEGGKMPLGLSATSRLDGTNSFPVQSAYNVLRVRCQYFSTLGDLEDPDRSSNNDQNIMSSDGRPIATITSGVAIYVTALLEFVAEYILQNVARVIERDNSDEASLNDLIKAMEEDEGTAYVWTKMNVRKEINATYERERQSGGKVVQRPWQVPDEDQLDMAAGGNKYKRQSLSTTASSHSLMTPSSSARRIVGSSSGGVGIASGQPTPESPYTAQPPVLKRRTSSERGAWFLGKRRGSFRSSQDLGSSFVVGTRDASNPAVLQPSDTNASALADSALDTGDDFDDLVLSGQTMKVSLTPNRLRSMDSSGVVADKAAEDGRRSARRRPGTGSLSLLPPTGKLAKATSAAAGTTSPEDPGAPRPDSRSTIGRPDSRRSVQTKSSAPPSAYRSIEGEGQTNGIVDDDISEEPENVWQAADPRRKTVNVREMVEAINGGHVSPSPTETTTFSAVPPSNGRESRMSLASLTSTSESKRLTLGAAGGKVLNLFTRKSSSTMPSPNPSLKSMTASRNVSGDKGMATSLFTATPPVGTYDNVRSQRSGSVVAASLGSGEQATAHAASVDTAAMRRTNSRSPELVRQVSETATEVHSVTPPANDETRSTTPGLVGLYEEPRANGSTSTVSSVVQQQNTARKVPWTYNRPPPSAHLPNGRRASGPLVGRASSSQGGHSGNDHSASTTAVSPITSAQSHSAAPPSAWAGQNGYTFDGDASSTTTAAYGNRTPIVGVSPTFGRSSPSIRTSVQTPLMSGKQADTARVLAQLNQKMRDCHSVEECQRLVMQALAVAAAAVHQEQETHNDNVTEAMKAAGLTMASQAVPVIETDTAAQAAVDKCIETDVPPASDVDYSTTYNTPLVREIVYRNLALPMAIGYDAENDDLLPAFRRQSQVAAWLLGEDDDEPQLSSTTVAASSKTVHPNSKNSLRPPLSRHNSLTSSGAGHESDFMSADEKPGLRKSITAAATSSPDLNRTISSSSSSSPPPHNGHGAMRSSRVIRTDSTRKRYALAAAKAAATSGSTTTTTTTTTISHPPSSFKHTANDEIVRTSEEDDLASDPARRISTVSSNFSTYKDAEDVPIGESPSTAAAT